MPTPAASASGDRRRDLLCLAILALVGGVLCEGLLRGSAGLGPEARLDGDALFGAGTPVTRPYDDLTPLVVETPRDRRIVERLRAGHLDLWNPLQGTGVPVAPDQGGMFSPLRIVHVLWPSQGGYVLLHCLRLWIGAAGAFYLARRRGISRAGATLAGGVFGLGGGMVAQLPFLCAAPVSLLPWVLGAQDDLLRRPAAGRRAIVGVAVALTLTAGHPTLAASVLIGALGHGVWCVGEVGEGRGRRLFDLAVGWAFGAAFAAPYLVSFAEYVANGYSYKHTWEGLGEHAVWRDFMRGMVGPAIAGPSSLDALRDKLPARAYPYELELVAGTAAWVLACVAALRRRVPRDLWALAALGAVLSFEPPPFEAAVVVPLLRDVLPRYHWQLVMLPVACAAGAGVDAIGSAEREGTWGEVRGLVAAVAQFAVVALAALGVGAFGARQYTTATPKLLAGLPEPRPGVVGYHMVVIGGVAAACALGRFAVRGRGVGLVVLAAADVVLLMRPHLKDRPAEALRRPFPAAVQRLAAAAAARHGRILGAHKMTAMAPLSSMAGIGDIRMSAPLVPARYDAFLRAAGAGDPFTYFTMPGTSSPWGDLAAVRFVLADAERRAGVAADRTMKVVETLPRATAFERSSAFGRARIFFGAAVAKGQDDAVARLRDLAKGGDHIDATRLGEVVVLEPAGGAVPEALAGKGSAEARWIRDEADEVILETDGAAPGYLMLADTYYPGWRATVDGRAAPIFPADVGFRAVAVPPGKHVVRFAYRPASLAYGLAILAVASAVAGLAVQRDRRRGGAGR